MTMLEKAARALNPIAWASEFNPEGERAAWERQDSLKQARAVLRAIREPDEEMSRAADDKVGRGAHEDWEGAYTAMIDAILEEKP